MSEIFFSHFKKGNSNRALLLLYLIVLFFSNFGKFFFDFFSSGITLDIDEDFIDSDKIVSVPMDKFKEACVYDVMKGLVVG